MIKGKFLLIGLTMLLIVLSVSGQIVNEFTERTCDLNGCKDTLYSYYKYYRNAENQFAILNESFDASNCQQGFAFCVDQNLVQFHAPQQLGAMKVMRNEKTVTFTPNGLSTTVSLPFSRAPAQVRGNTVTYADIIPHALDVRYTYTWSGVKEEFIVKQNVFETLSPNSIARFDFTLATDLSTTNQGNRLLFSDRGATQFVLEHLYATDSRGKTIQLAYTYNANSLQLEIPISYLRNATYPVVIDPTLTLGNTNVINNGYISYDGDSSTYTRYASGAGLEIKAGDDSFLIAGLSLYHGVMEWNIASLLKNATIADINLTVFFNSTADAKNQNFSIKSMDGNWTAYADNNTGNQQFYADMGDGTLLENRNVSAPGWQSFNLTSFDGGLDLYNKRLNQLWWGLGFSTTPEDGTGSWPQRISAANDVDASRRPVLVITYAYATEENADAAIEQGVHNSLPVAFIHGEQQIYIRKANNIHQQGRFDKFAINSLKRWAFNYISEGEDPTTMLNLSTTVFVYEITNLTVDQIRTQVELYINATKSL